MSNLGLECYKRFQDEAYRSIEEYCSELIEDRYLERVASPCIFRASTALLKECADAYVPQIVSIGPYHGGQYLQLWETEINPCIQKRELWGMETFKDEAVRRVLVRIQVNGHRWEDKRDLCRRMMMEIVMSADEIRRCYDKEISISMFPPVMMARDACFILEFFRCLFNDSERDSENLERFCPDFRSNFNPFVSSEIMKDLIKLENQIPLVVLEGVLAMEMGGDLKKAKSSLQLLLKAVFHKFYYRPFDCVVSGECSRQNHILDVYYHCCLGDEDHGEEKEKREELQEENQKREELQEEKQNSKDLCVNHILDVYYHCFLGDEDRREEKQKREELQEENQKSKDLWVNLGNYVEHLEEHQSERQKIPSAVELEKGGVKIKATGKTVKNIGFQGRTLKIPPVQLDSDSEIFIRNLMALENCYLDGSSRRMTAFVQFMNELCQTEKGAAVMRESGVIVGNLWQDSQVTRLFSSCLQSHSVPSYIPIEETRTKLMKYYSRKRRIAAAKAWTEFRKTYFSKPWILIGGIGATIILILTAIQVFCLFHSCGAH